jgi:hypothetical protein
VTGDEFPHVAGVDPNKHLVNKGAHPARSDAIVPESPDETQLMRSDRIPPACTLSLRSGKSVVVTLWGENASGPLSDSLATGMVVQITNCRVSDFNGEQQAKVHDPRQREGGT